MSSTNHHPSRPGTSRPHFDDVAWLVEIDAVDRSVNLLLAAKRAALRRDPQEEQLLWIRHIDRLRMIKRKLDAVCM